MSNKNFIKGIIVLGAILSLSLLMYFSKGFYIRIGENFELTFFLEALLIFISIPFISALFINYLDKIKQQGRRKLFVVAFLLSLVLMVYGAGLHNSANQIHALVEAPIIYFYDEILSHWVFWTGLLALVFVLTIAQYWIPQEKPLEKRTLLLVRIAGIFAGMLTALNTLESHYGIAFFVIALFMGIYFFFKTHRQDAAKLPLIEIIKYACISGIIFLIAWVIVYGGFFEPSAVGFGRF